MLLVTESAVEFDKLRDELLQDIQPQGAIERQYAEDIAYLTWEVRRYRETKAGIINAALLSANRSQSPQCTQQHGSPLRFWKEAVQQECVPTRPVQAFVRRRVDAGTRDARP